MLRPYGKRFEAPAERYGPLRAGVIDDPRGAGYMATRSIRTIAATVIATGLPVWR